MDTCTDTPYVGYIYDAQNDEEIANHLKGFGRRLPERFFLNLMIGDRSYTVPCIRIGEKYYVLPVGLGLQGRTRGDKNPTFKTRR